jgi:hypothetical protein
MLVAALPASAVTLYDPGLGSLPGAQGWSTAWSSRPGSQSLVDGLLQIDTTGAGVQAFGSGRTVLPALDTVAGFRLSWQMQVVSEQHSSDNRAGFSVLMQGADQTQSLELGFWQDSVWALSYQAGAADSGIVRAETAAIDTSSALRQYTLTVQQGSFSLQVDGTTALGGALRDYPKLGLSTLPYGFESYLFMGDNSSRGQSVVQLGAVSLQPVPEPTSFALWAAGLGFGVWRLRRSSQA